MVGSAVRLHDTGKKGDVEFKLSFPKQDSGLVVIDFRFMMPEPANSHKVARVYGEKEAIQIETEGGHLSYRHDGKEYTPLLDSYDPNRWYAIRIAADPVLRKADVYVDGIRKIAGAPFRGEATYLDRLVTHTSNGGTTDHLIDDIRISSVVY